MPTGASNITGITFFTWTSEFFQIVHAERLKLIPNLFRGFAASFNLWLLDTRIELCDNVGRVLTPSPPIDNLSSRVAVPRLAAFFSAIHREAVIIAISLVANDIFAVVKALDVLVADIVDAFDILRLKQTEDRHDVLLAFLCLYDVVDHKNQREQRHGDPSKH